MMAFTLKTSSGRCEREESQGPWDIPRETVDVVRQSACRSFLRAQVFKAVGVAADDFGKLHLFLVD